MIMIQSKLLLTKNYFAYIFGFFHFPLLTKVSHSLDFMTFDVVIVFGTTAKLSSCVLVTFFAPFR